MAKSARSAHASLEKQMAEPTLSVSSRHVRLTFVDMNVYRWSIPAARLSPLFDLDKITCILPLRDVKIAEKTIEEILLVMPPEKPSARELAMREAEDEERNHILSLGVSKEEERKNLLPLERRQQDRKLEKDRLRLQQAEMHRQEWNQIAQERNLWVANHTIDGGETLVYTVNNPFHPMRPTEGLVCTETFTRLTKMWIGHK